MDRRSFINLNFNNYVRIKPDELWKNKKIKEIRNEQNMLNLF